MPGQEFYLEKPDHDTLGGRLVRARSTSGMSELDLARRLGVKRATIQSWESDRAEPRSNRLSMLAGVLGVSPTWLLHGIGSAPLTESLSDELRILHNQVDRLRDLHRQSGEMIESLQSAINGMSDREL